MSANNIALVWLNPVLFAVFSVSGSEDPSSDAQKDHDNSNNASHTPKSDERLDKIGGDLFLKFEEYAHIS
jgi:hypothetical protein